VQMFNTTKCSDPVCAGAGAEDPRRATLIADVFADFKRGCLQNRNTHPPRVTPEKEKPRIGQTKLARAKTRAKRPTKQPVDLIDDDHIDLAAASSCNPRRTRPMAWRSILAT